MRYHLMGISGSGMNGLSRWLAHLGHDVDGCDRSAAVETSVDGIRRLPGHDPSHVHGVDVLVHSAAIPPDHPEIAAARAASVRVLRRSEMLAELAADHLVLAVAGAHGKTTTTALTGWALQEAGLDPTVLVGGEVPGWPGGFRPGGRLTVIEADEYDRAFLRIPHAHSAVTSFDLEHLECYGSPEALRFAFEVFLELTLPGGGVVIPVEESALGSWAARIGRRIVTTGPGGDSYCLPLGAEGWGERYSIDGIEGIVPLPGLANLRNAATAHALLGLCGVSVGVAARSMASFPGTRRRLERLGSAGRTLIVSDYAHHPREMEASIQALRRAVPGRISVVFEPHLYSRTAAMHAEMGRAVSLADSSAVLPVYAAREAPVAGVDSSLVVRSASEAGADCVALDPRDVLSFVESCGSDAVVFMGAGDCDRLARGLLEARR